MQSFDHILVYKSTYVYSITVVYCINKKQNGMYIYIYISVFYQTSHNVNSFCPLPIIIELIPNSCNPNGNSNDDKSYVFVSVE